MKRAVIYQHKGRFFVHASSRTTDGVWIFDEPCLELTEDVSNSALGKAIRTALDGSRTEVPHPQKWTGILTPLLKQAGVKSWRTFAKTAECAEVEEQGPTITVIPARNLGVDEGFEANYEKAVVVERAEIDDLGACARAALQ